MWKQMACDALNQGKRLEIVYDGSSRVVEVHAVGRTKDGSDVARVWQVRGGSESRQYVGWKLLTIREARGAHVIDERSEAPRHGYKRDDPVMVHYDCRI